MLRKVLIFIMILFWSGVVFSQVKDPNVPRFWWKSVKRYIDEKTDNKIMVFDADSIANHNVAIFNLNQPIKVQRIDIMTEGIVDSPTVFYFQSASVYDSVLIDSANSGKYYFSTDTVNFPASPCTLRFTDTQFSYKATGGGNTRIVIQFTNR